MTLTDPLPGFQDRDIKFYSTSSASETTPDTATVTIKRQYEIICALSNDDRAIVTIEHQ